MVGRAIRISADETSELTTQELRDLEEALLGDASWVELLLDRR
jgi:hypothetical protein